MWVVGVCVWGGGRGGREIQWNPALTQNFIFMKKFG